MTFYFCAKLSERGMPFIYDIECELDCHIDDDDGTAEPYLTVDAVSIGGVKMPRPYRLNPTLNSLNQNITAEIIRQAEADDDLFQRVAEASGLTYVGAPNDPEGHWRYAAE